MKYPPAFIDQVFEASNIIEYISQFTSLRPSGGGFIGRCPFPDHPEKTPSFSVSETKQVYHCFGCGKSGNIFSFLKDYNGMGFKDAIEYLAGRANLEIPTESQSPALEKNASLKKQIIEINKLALEYFKNEFRNSESARRYAIERGLDSEILKTFQLGYAPDSWDGLASFLTTRNVQLELAEKAKLVKPRKEGNGFYDVFRNRLMFPIFNAMGEPVAFGGRSFDGSEPKYLNSPESQAFFKGKIFYGAGITTRFLRGSTPILIVEGYMDLIALYQAGFQAVLATLGTALTLEHCYQLKKLGSHVIALFDGDRAGQNAMERSLPIFFAAGVWAKAVVLPDGKDPDDFLKTDGREKLSELIDSAPDIFHLVLKKWVTQTAGNLSDRLALVIKVQEVLERIPSAISQRAYAHVAADILGVDLQAFTFSKVKPTGASNQQLKESPKNANQRPTISADLPAVAIDPELPVETQIVISRAPRIELEVLRLVVKNHAHFEELSVLGWRELLTDPGTHALMEKLEELSRQKPGKFDTFLSLLISQIDSPSILIKSFSEPADEAAYFLDLLRNLKMLSIQRKIEQISRLIKLKPETDLMNELVDLKKRKLGLRTCGADEVIKWLQ